MRILIEVSGGVVQNVVVERYPDDLVGKKPEIILADYDNLNAGQPFDGGEYPVQYKSWKEFDTMMEALAEKYNSTAPGDDRDQT